MNFRHLTEAYINSLSIVERKKHLLKIRIIGLLYLNGQRSNAEIGQRLSISSPTSVSLLNELIDEGMVEKKGRGESRGGRRPDLYRLKDNCIFVLAVHMGKYKTEMAIFNNNNENISGSRIISFDLKNGSGAIDAVVEEANALIAASKIDPLQLWGVGVNMPGLVDAKEGVNYTYLYTEQTSLKELLQDKFGRPVFIENDAKARTMAEYRFGIARDRKNALALFLDWGIGLGIIQEGKLYRGANGFAGEFGHISIIENGKLCTCGKQGCLETVASGTALAEMAKEGIRLKKSSILTDYSQEDLDKIDPSMVAEAAVRGDQYAINIIGEVGLNLGKAISILIQLFNPELIILGGKIAEARQYLTIPIIQALNMHCMPQLAERTSIQISDLGRQTGILGSVAIVTENIFEKALDGNTGI